ncbi:hypothetical protein PHYSODRAFT_257161 [Phytophthora sojae]|uniref:MULE transposase domain-containing protein n=1 Tax=Phytophthora sojae (strain P6497) TaxID=1094619 RepID=G4YK18_PHYSP|nr:hypothetical protein PHYSODRAFT_257161 [Phytophthora sojae]EGZ27523.1 hypothetical protein PHYSODRAFT_257161 [Phytophthora sojae]|eukprot:XP_009514798.1 hypothetical protein PHYSODRAFT_257161 [Phytophthora sojae]
MRTAHQSACLSNLSLPPGMVWQRVMASMREAYPDATLSTITRQPGISIIKYTRAQVTGSDALRVIESAPLGNDLGGHPELVRLLRYLGAAVFINGTFEMVPKPSTQCLIVMVRDPGVDLYVPAMYVLMDSKQQDAYWSALN